MTGPTPQRLAEIEQMCSAPSDGYSAGAWCEAANDLLAALFARDQALAMHTGFLRVMAEGLTRSGQEPSAAMIRTHLAFLAGAVGGEEPS